MPAKKLDLGKAIEREHYEPKLGGQQAGKPAKEKIEQKNDSNSQSFEMRLKTEFPMENKKLAVENIELGITSDEVIKIAGKPHSIVEWYTGNLKYNYGKVWVVIENGVVTCLVRAKYFEKYWGRNDYQSRNPRAIIK